MMMRIIETLLLKTQAYTQFSRKKRLLPLTSRPIRPIRNLLNLKLATRSKLFSIE